MTSRFILMPGVGEARTLSAKSASTNKWIEVAISARIYTGKWILWQKVDKEGQENGKEPRAT